MIFIIMVLLLAVMLLLGLNGRRRWRAENSAMRHTVLASAKPLPGVVDFAELDTLPPVVQRYFRHVLTEGRPLIHTAYTAQEGGFRTKPEMKRWMPMQARQVFTVHPSGFVWTAVITMAPGMPVCVADAYIHGQGSMQGKALYLIPVINCQGAKALHLGALQRYLAEAVWFPTALLPCSGVQWTAIDAHSARATLHNAGHTVSVDFTFNADNEIVQVYSAARFREVDGAYLPTPWEGRFSDYQAIEGYRIPLTAEVGWHLDSGLYTYWRAKIHSVRFE